MADSPCCGLGRIAEHFAGVHDPQRVERLLDLAHHLHGRSMLKVEQVTLVQADAVLARAGAPEADGALAGAPGEASPTGSTG
jgi:hypothetical protein